jgi:CBS domain-containing protein
MLSCVTSTLVTKLAHDESIYTLQLIRRGIDIRRREENLMRAFTVGQVMHGDAPSLLESAPFPEVVQHFLSSPFPLCFVVDEQRVLRGVISIHDVKVILQEEMLGPLVIARDLAQQPQTVVHPEDTLAHCLEKFTRTEQEYLPVATSAGALCGYLSQHDVLDLYQREILRHEYLGLNVRAEGVSSGVFEQVRLPQSYTVEVMPVPPFLVGQTLRDAQLRTRYRLTVVAIRRGGIDRPDELPDPNWTLRAHDYVVLVGHPLDLQHVMVATSEHQEPTASDVAGSESRSAALGAAPSTIEA